jgi:hypothetical protein
MRDVRVILGIKLIADLLATGRYRWCDIRCDLSLVPAANLLPGNRDEPDAISDTFLVVALPAQFGSPAQANRSLSQVVDSSSACFALSTIPYMWKKP